MPPRLRAMLAAAVLVPASRAACGVATREAARAASWAALATSPSAWATRPANTTRSMNPISTGVSTASSVETAPRWSRWMRVIGLAPG